MNNYSVSFLESRKDKVSENTFLAYDSDLKAFFDYLEINNISFFDIKKTDIQDYISFLNEYMSPASITRKISVIKSFYKYLVKMNVLQSSPADNVKYIKEVKNNNFDFLSRRDIDKLLLQPDSMDPKGIRDKAMIHLLYSTGLRISELLNIDIDNVDLYNGTISIIGQNSYRKIDITSVALYDLKCYISSARNIFIGNNSQSEALFLNVSGKRMTRQGVWKILKAYAAKANLSYDISPHTLRNSFVIHMLQDNIHPSTLMDLLGIDNISSIRSLKKD